VVDTKSEREVAGGRSGVEGVIIFRAVMVGAALVVLSPLVVALLLWRVVEVVWNAVAYFVRRGGEDDDEE